RNPRRRNPHGNPPGKNLPGAAEIAPSRGRPGEKAAPRRICSVLWNTALWNRYSLVGMQSALPPAAAPSPLKKLIALAMMLGAVWLMPAQAQRVEDYELAPVNYSASQPQDLIAHLEQRLLRGELQLQGDGRNVLQTLLRELQIPVASQMLVFSRTSLQRERITPATPRAIYFSDDVYLGWVPGGLIEIASMDEQLGPVFYALDPRGEPLPGKPRFARPGDCLRCHGGNFVRGIPGLFARSVFPDSRGEPLFRHGGELVDHRTPFAQRWGGWYVTGTHG